MIKYLAIIAAWVGDKDLAFEQLATAVRYPYSGDEFSYGELKLMPWWDPLRGDPRFEKTVEDAKQPVALVRKLFAEDVERVSALGVNVHVPTPGEMEAWQIAARRPYARYKAQTEPRIVSGIEEIVAKTRKA